MSFVSFPHEKLMELIKRTRIYIKVFANHLKDSTGNLPSYARLTFPVVLCLGFLRELLDAWVYRCHLEGRRRRWCVGAEMESTAKLV